MKLNVIVFSQEYITHAIRIDAFFQAPGVFSAALQTATRRTIGVCQTTLTHDQGLSLPSRDLVLILAAAASAWDLGTV